MTTKEQERKALEQIRKIVSGLGEDSYVGTAFEGCFEIAEENIQHDFACSTRDRLEGYQSEVEEMASRINGLVKKLDGLKDLLKDKDEIIKRRGDRIEDLNKQLRESVDTAVEAWAKVHEAEETIQAKDNEIIHLKAKLYDLMMK